MRIKQSRLEVVQNSPGNEVTVSRAIKQRVVATKAVNESDVNGIYAKWLVRELKKDLKPFTLH